MLGHGVWAFVKDVLAPLASVIIAIFVFYYGKQFNDRQVANQVESNKTQAQQAETARQDLQLKILADFTNSITQLTDQSPDGDKNQTIAAIKFVQYGEQALPVIKIAMGVADNTVRRGAAVVAVQMFQSEKVGRERMLKELMGDFKSNNPYLRRGVLECLVKLEDQLTKNEADNLVQLFKTELNPQADCSRDEDNVLLEAAIFLDGQMSLASEELLIQIAENRSATKARIQAVDSLANVVRPLGDEERTKIAARLQPLTSDAGPDLLRSLTATLRQLQSPAR